MDTSHHHPSAGNVSTDSAPATQGSVTQDSRTVRAYLQQVQSPATVSLGTVERRLNAIDVRLANESLDIIERLRLTQERLDRLQQYVDIKRAEQLQHEFALACARYSERNGISYGAWREMGVEASVLAAAGLRGEAAQARALLPGQPTVSGAAPNGPTSKLVAFLRENGAITVGLDRSVPTACKAVGALLDVSDKQIANTISRAEAHGHIKVIRGRTSKGHNKILSITLPLADDETPADTANADQQLAG